MASSRKNDSTVSDLANSTQCVFTSTHRDPVKASKPTRHFLSQSGIEKELEITVSTIIESEDSDVLGTEGEAGTTTETEEDNPPLPPLLKIAPEPAETPVAGPSTSIRVRKVTLPVGKHAVPSTSRGERGVRPRNEVQLFSSSLSPVRPGFRLTPTAPTSPHSTSTTPHSTTTTPSLLTSSYLFRSIEKKRKRRLDFSSSSSEDEERVDDPAPTATPVRAGTARKGRGGRARGGRRGQRRVGGRRGRVIAGAARQTDRDLSPPSPTFLSPHSQPRSPSPHQGGDETRQWMPHRHYSH
ncbi:hypothetical protein Pmani_003845 [Petrolisthes manimaculis]|uniref:Uncharacterized protein n=1 Tax=Petrolisthes manimaculis TaxID=1843537 RepID=A0AAE1QFS6_9EUCA|nr:hypothetical protein Pmani_003845 [Petrolisthes manimaculis]